MGWDQAATLINDASGELGLGGVDDPYASDDPIFVKLRGYLKSIGRLLQKKATWQQLDVSYTFNTNDKATNNEFHPLPNQFGRPQRDAFWNNTNKTPMLPISAAEWRAIKAVGAYNGVRTPYRLRMRGAVGGSEPPVGIKYQIDIPIEALPASPTLWSLTIEFVSEWWAGDVNSEVPSKEYPTAKDDLVYFDPDLVKKALVNEWNKKNGNDTTASQRDYDEALRLAMGNQTSPARKLHIDGRKDEQDLVDYRNMPLGNWGV